VSLLFFVRILITPVTAFAPQSVAQGRESPRFDRVLHMRFVPATATPAKSGEYTPAIDQYESLLANRPLNPAK